MNTIELTKKIIVSDPCYDRGTWCQIVLDNVKEGKYDVIVHYEKSGRVKTLAVIHNSVRGKQKKWIEVEGTLGVDSGQLGIFSFDSYRNDDVFKNIPSKFGEKYVAKPENGEHWYTHMCDRTLCDKLYGTYNNGVVSSSGYGDGSYPLDICIDNDEIVGLSVQFI